MSNGHRIIDGISNVSIIPDELDPNAGSVRLRLLGFHQAGESIMVDVRIAEQVGNDTVEALAYLTPVEAVRLAKLLTHFAMKALIESV